MNASFEWVVVKDRDELEAFFRTVISKIRVAAKAEGYAIGVHGSLRRDLDLIAIPWVDQYSDKDQLAIAIHRAACGIEMQTYQWERKPHGRVATCFPICFPEFYDGNTTSLGHVDLSVVDERKLDP